MEAHHVCGHSPARRVLAYKTALPLGQTFVSQLPSDSFYRPALCRPGAYRAASGFTPSVESRIILPSQPRPNLVVAWSHSHLGSRQTTWDVGDAPADYFHEYTKQ